MLTQLHNCTFFVAQMHLQKRPAVFAVCLLFAAKENMSKISKKRRKKEQQKKLLSIACS